jgi:hypothetical protein
MPTPHQRDSGGLCLQQVGSHGRDLPRRSVRSLPPSSVAATWRSRSSSRFRADAAGECQIEGRLRVSVSRRRIAITTRTVAPSMSARPSQLWRYAKYTPSQPTATAVPTS